MSLEWFYNGKIISEIPNGILGFIYEIENTITGQKYIGKKLFQFSKTKIVKGKKKKFKIESDWRTYTGSSEELNADIQIYGEQFFTKKILTFCKTKSEMSYIESKEIFTRDALLKEEYYNKWVSCKIRKGPGLKDLYLS